MREASSRGREDRRTGTVSRGVVAAALRLDGQVNSVDPQERLRVVELQHPVLVSNIALVTTRPC
jgi:hypothetical protein